MGSGRRCPRVPVCFNRLVPVRRAPRSWRWKRLSDLLLLTGTLEPSTEVLPALGLLLHSTGLDCPLMIIVTEGGLAAVSADWGADDVVLNTAGPAEVEARLRLALGRRARNAAVDAPDEIPSGDLTIDDATHP